MVHTMQLATRCRQGRLVITSKTVSLRRRHSLRRRPLWMVERTQVVGASIAREPGVVCLRICTGDGASRRVDPLVPVDALRVVALLGYAIGVSPALCSDTQGLPAAVKMPCAGGRAELEGSRLTFRPRLPWHQSHAWTLSLDQILGVSSTLRPGARMLHDVAIHATDGGIYVLRRLRPEHAFALSRLCGHLYAALPVEPKSQREAIEFHITTPLRSVSAPVPLAIEPSKRRTKRRRLQRELDDFWSQQRSASDRFRPLAGA